MKATQLDLFVIRLTTGVTGDLFAKRSCGELPRGWAAESIKAMAVPGTADLAIFACARETVSGQVVGAKRTRAMLDFIADDAALDDALADMAHEIQRKLVARRAVDNPRVLQIVNESPWPLERATAGSVGFDLRANCEVARDIDGGRRWKFDTGLRVLIPAGHVGLVQPRSGLALHHGIVAVTGVIDRDYTGSVGVLLVNTTSNSFRVNPGDRIAQLVVVHAGEVEVAEVKDLPITDRGDRGWGSTGA